MSETSKKRWSTQDQVTLQRAQLDQKEKQFERQYDVVSPKINLLRMGDLEVWAFRIELMEWNIDKGKETPE